MFPACPRETYSLKEGYDTDPRIDDRDCDGDYWSTSGRGGDVESRLHPRIVDHFCLWKFDILLDPFDRRISWDDHLYPDEGGEREIRTGDRIGKRK